MELTNDNRWMVLFSTPVLQDVSGIYCSSVKAIKYICKYIDKGSDQAVFSIGQQGSESNTLMKCKWQMYQLGRYISSVAVTGVLTS